MSKGILSFLLFTLLMCPSYAKNIQDTPNTDLRLFFTQPNTTYIIKHPHQTKATIKLPPNIVIQFQGGSIAGKLVFNNTLLKGKVKLQGSSISGTLKNDTFNAKWLCYADGKKDDAANINNLFQTCNTIYFPKGIYLLTTIHTPTYKLPKPYHLGINRSNINLIGENGAILTTQTKAGTLCIYSKPNDIKNSIHDIKIEGLTFNVQNEKTEWDSYQEHCHTISLIGVNRFCIENCKFHNFWGDAICLNHYSDDEKTGERARNMNVTIHDNNINGYKFCNRNGVSVINGQNVIIEKNKFINTSHSNMPGAIDIEANNKAYTVDNIIIRNNRIDNSQGMNAAISVISNERGAPAHNIEITKNKITNSRRAFRFYIWTDYAADHITVKENWADKNTEPWRWDGKGRTRNWVFTDNTFLRNTNVKFGQDVKIEGLTYRNNRLK